MRLWKLPNRRRVFHISGRFYDFIRTVHAIIQNIFRIFALCFTFTMILLSFYHLWIIDWLRFIQNYFQMQNVTEENMKGFAEYYS